ncbi:uncharacterized protein [Phyllobates terribilis]|uniref:uncharacterized protein n=1 Tax=Phyllobates terribilis TaxID=111132 RepID=UPI003CCA9A9A
MFGYNTEECWNADYDSTWEDEEPPQKKQKSLWDNFSNRSARDMQNYRHEYGEPDLDTADDLDYPEEMPNLLFYQNRIAFQPYGARIEYIHFSWWNNYEELESNHSYIQWLFPLREPGVNRYATPLTPAEIKRMRADEDVMWRLLESYKLMLGFYGIQLLDEKSGEVSRTENWEERYHNLNRRSHNNLRITRILKCLGEMGYDHLQAPLVQFFLEETLCNNQLPNVKRSVLDYFMFTVKDKQQRRRLVHFAWENYKSQRPFIWGPVEKLRNLTAEKEKENEGTTEEMERKEENPRPPSNDLHQHLQQETGTEDMGDDSRSGVGRTQDHEASEPKDAVTSSRNEWPITEDSSSENEQQTTEDNSAVNERQITEDSSSGNEQQTTEDNSAVNERHITEDSSSGNEQQTTEDNSAVNERQITEDSSSGNEQQTTEDNSSRNERQITEDSSSGNEQLTTEDNSSVNERQITEDSSSGNEQQTTEDNSSVNERPITEDSSSENEQQTTEDDSSINERQTTEDNSSRNEQQTTEDSSSGYKRQITEDNNTRNEHQTTEDNTSRNERQITEDNSSRNEQLTTEDNSSRYKRQITEDNNTRNEHQTTEDNSSRNERQITEDNSSRNERQITEDNNTRNEHQTTEDSSSGYEQQTTENNSSATKRLITIDNGSGNERLMTENISLAKENLITVGNSSGNEQLITESNIISNELLVTQDNGSGNKQLITAVTVGNGSRNGQPIKKDSSSRSEQLITVDNSLNYEMPIKDDNSLTYEKLKTEDNSSVNNKATESTSLINLKETLVGDKKLLAQGTRKDNEGLTTADNEGLITADNEGLTTADNEGLTTAETNFANKNKITRTQPGAHQAKGTQNKEKQKLMSHKEDGIRNESKCDYILSFFGICCVNCVCCRLSSTST